MPLTLLLTVLAAAPIRAAQDVPPSASAVAQETPATELPVGWVPITTFGDEAVETIQETYPDGRLRRIACYLAGRRDAQALHGPEWTYWSNGVLQAQRIVVHGKQHGYSISCHESGMVESSGEYRDDVRQGRWSFYNERGALKETREYDRGELHGQVLVFHPSGETRFERQYERGLQCGIEREFDGHGELLRTSTFRGGKLHGPGERGDARGGRLVESYEDGKKSGTWEHWNAEGVRLLAEEYRNDVRHGTSERWRPDGTIAYRMHFVEGRAEGALTAWHDNGQMQMQGELVDGKRTGTWRYWRRDGSLIEAGSGEYAEDRKVSAD